MNRYICVHGHFYQPPRENPWLDAVELQDSAFPYHDWNARIMAECYAPNAASRILDDDGRITRIVSNYERISFNFGPTLLAWLERHSPATYAAVIEADARSREHFGGHGSALAQPYNHMIMPLASPRDRRTQVRWGIADFRARFGRPPEGMWLPETAVDLDTLEALAGEGIRFTILEPGQAGRVRALDGDDWTDVRDGRIDTRRPYLQRLPSGANIALFFYDAALSRAVAFEGLLGSGARFADRLAGAFGAAGDDGPALVHIASDGETYGHHHRHGDMALAFALARIEARADVALTNYAEHLERRPPTHEVEIIENTSWSCAHGVERWRSDCGCHTGGQPGWTQAWRAPLRDALDLLRDELEPRYEEAAGTLLQDPWAARDDYVHVVLDRDRANVETFLARYGARPLEGDEAVRALRLLELQRNAMLMYTSCGWFFNDLSGIETVQVLRYAGRVLQLAQQALAVDLEPRFLERLASARSNVPEQGDGRAIYDRYVRPAMVDPLKVAAHYAMLSLFEPVEEQASVYCYDVRVVRHESRETGGAHVELGEAGVTSRITLQHRDVTYVAAHFGGQNVFGGVRDYGGEGPYEALVRDTAEAFARADFPAVVRLLDDAFGRSTYSLGTLFRDEQRRIIEILLHESIEAMEASYLRLYNRASPLMRFVSELGLPQPRAFRMTAEFVLNTRLRRLFDAEVVDLDEVRSRLDEARAGAVPLDADELSYALAGQLERVARDLDEAPDSLDALDRLHALAEVAGAVPFEVSLWEPQNVFFRLLESRFPEARSRAEAGDEAERAWTERFTALAGPLRVRLDGR